MFAVIENGVLARYPANPIADNPDTSFGEGWSGGVVNGTEYVTVVPIDQPAYDPMTQNCVEGDPKLIKKVWEQAWDVSAASTQEQADRLTAWRDTLRVTRFQAKATMLQQGILSQVEALIAQADALTQLAWNDALTFERQSPLLNHLAAQLGMTDAEIDDFFVAASQVTA